MFLMGESNTIVNVLALAVILFSAIYYIDQRLKVLKSRFVELSASAESIYPGKPAQPGRADNSKLYFGKL